MNIISLNVCVTFFGAPLFSEIDRVAILFIVNASLLAFIDKYGLPTK